VLVITALMTGYVYYQLPATELQGVVPVQMDQESVSQSDVVPTTGALAQIAQFTNEAYAFGFTFRIKPYGYSVFENTAAQNSEQGMLFGVTLLRSEDYNAVESAAAQGIFHDGPPSMSVLVFDAKGVQDGAAWLTENQVITNCEEGTALATVVSGKDAASCLWDGLYSGVTIVLLHKDRVYVFVGTREEGETVEGYSRKQDFEDLVASFNLTRV
jgi:hypothetical protein